MPGAFVARGKDGLVLQAGALLVALGRESQEPGAPTGAEAVPVLRQAARVRRAGVVIDAAAVGHIVAIAGFGGTQAEIDGDQVAVEAFIQPAERDEDVLAHQAAGARDRWPAGRFRAGRSALVAARRHRPTGGIELQADVVDQAAERFALHVADAAAIQLAPEQLEHRWQPIRQQHGVVVQQTEHGRLSEFRAGVDVAGEALRPLVAQTAE